MSFLSLVLLLRSRVAAPRQPSGRDQPRAAEARKASSECCRIYSSAHLL